MGPVKPQQHLEPYDYRAVLFTYSKNEQRFGFIQKVSGTYISALLDTDELKMALRAQKVSGLSRYRSQLSNLKFSRTNKLGNERKKLDSSFLNFRGIIQSNLSTTVTLGEGFSVHCGQVAMVGRLK